PHRVSQCNDSHHLDPRHHHYLRHLLFFLMTPPPPSSTLFPYTTLFRSMLESFAQQAAPEIKERIAKVNLLLPGLTDEQLANCQILIDAALKADARPNFLNCYYTTKGVAEYRAGRHDAAIQWLTRARAGEYGPYSR